jgi:TrmH family RNA methyltransferase
VAPLGAHHPDLRRLRRLLRDAALRRDEATIVAEGPRLLSAALALAPERIREVYVTAAARREHAAVVDAVAAPVREIGDSAAARAADVRSAQGVVALVDRVPATLDSVLAALGDAAVVLVIDEIGDPGNLGTIVRSAAWFGAAAVVVGPRSVDAYNPKAVRASAGACFAIPILEASLEQMSTAQVLDALGERGVRRFGTRAGAAAPIATAALDGRVALVLGHETRGVPADLPLDGEVAIPRAGAGESLNVAMTATVCCYEISRRRGPAGR